MPSNPSKIFASQLQDFGELQARYQSLSLAHRAAQVIEDADPALSVTEHILQELSVWPHTKKAFVELRKNAALVSRIRPSEAKNLLLDATCDFIESTHNKLAAWRKTMERVSQGEGIMVEKNKEYISSEAPVAAAIAGNACISNYLSVLQLVLMELGKLDGKNTGHYASVSAEMRRCGTVLSDCEIASEIDKVVH